jgi:hypothetical protein
MHCQDHNTPFDRVLENLMAAASAHFPPAIVFYNVADAW